MNIYKFGLSFTGYGIVFMGFLYVLIKYLTS